MEQTDTVAHHEGCRATAHQERSRLSIAERSGNKYLSQESRPILVMSMGLVTISSIVVAHRALNIDIPFPLILALTVLDIVVPRYRAFAAGTLGILYGLIILPLGIIYVIFARKDPAEYLIANLEKIIAIIRNTSDQHSRQKVP